MDFLVPPPEKYFTVLKWWQLQLLVIFFGKHNDTKQNFILTYQGAKNFTNVYPVLTLASKLLLIRFTTGLPTSAVSSLFLSPDFDPNISKTNSFRSSWVRWPRNNSTYTHTQPQNKTRVNRKTIIYVSYSYQILLIIFILKIQLK